MPARPALCSALLLLAALLAYLVGNASAPLFDRDEPRYAITSRNMLTDGDFVVPRQYDRPRFAKPPMIYWLQAAAMKLLGQTSEFAARLPSSLAMWAVVALLLAFLWHESDPLTALLATTIFAFSGLTLFLAKAAITDATLLLSTSIALASLYRLWRGDRSLQTFLLLGLATGLGALTKGPVILAIQAATAAALAALWLLDKKFPARSPWQTFDFPPARRPTKLPTWLKTLLAIAIVLAIALPWLYLVEERSRDKYHTSFIANAFHREIIERNTNLKGVDGQGRPPGFYLLSVFGTFFPWSFLLPAALTIAFRERHRPLTRFCLAAALGPWLLFESVTSKMVHWFLPVFLPLSVLTAQAISLWWNSKHTDLTRRAFTIVSAAWAAIVILLGLAPWLLLLKFPGTPWWTAALLTAWAIALALTSFHFLYARKLPQAITSMAAHMALLFPLLFTLIIPHWPFITLGRTVGTHLRTLGATAPNDVVMIRFQEPSVAFYQGGTIREKFRTALELPPNAGPSWAAIRQDIWDNEVPAVTKSQWEILAQHTGVAYAESPNIITVLIIHRR